MIRTINADRFVLIPVLAADEVPAGLTRLAQPAAGKARPREAAPDVRVALHQAPDEAGAIRVNKAAGQGLQRLRLSTDLRRVVATKRYGEALLQGPAGNLCRLGPQIVVLSAGEVLVYEAAADRFVSGPMRFPWLGKNVRKLFPQADSTVLVLRQDGSLNRVTPHRPASELPVKTDQWVEEYENLVALDTAYLALCRENGFELVPRSALPWLAGETVRPPVIRRVASLGNPAFSQLHQGLASPPELLFSHQQPTLLIDFCTPVYTRPVRYRYWLENNRPGWSAYETIYQKEFGSLPPGQYVFHLKSDLSAAESSLTFDILPPWYWTACSKGLYLLPGAFGLRLLCALHLRRVLSKQQQVREKLEEQLRFQEEHSQREMVMLQKEQLEQGLIQKSEELANSTMLLIHKNELLIQLKSELNRLNQQPGQRLPGEGFQRIGALIDTNISTKQDWKLFETNFNRVHEQFLRHLIDHFPDLSQGDLKLAAYLRMNLSTKEIAQLLNITHRSVELKRYRLRRKLCLDAEVNLSEFMMKH